MQHAFRTGKSTETAISQTVNMIEKGLRRQKFALATFIDIASAFDRLDPDAAKRGGMNKHISNWYGKYLKHRIATINIKGLTCTRRLSIGCRNGGILSVLIWILAFDDLLERFEGREMCWLCGRWLPHNRRP